MKIYSKPLLSEFKNFVARANSFASKPGETDDLVMAMVLNIRMVEYISTFEDDVYNVMNSSLGADLFDEDDSEGPMPLGLL